MGNGRYSGRKNRGRCKESVEDNVIDGTEERKGHIGKRNKAKEDGKMRKLRKKVRMDGKWKRERSCNSSHGLMKGWRTLE